MSSETNDTDQELLIELRNEAEEHLGEVEPLLLVLETQDEKTCRESINTIFRAVHSIKGAAGLLSLQTLERISHAMENLLMPVRDGKEAYRLSMTGILLQGIDLLRRCISALPENIVFDYSGFVAELEVVRKNIPVAAAEASPAPTSTLTAPPTPTPLPNASETIVALATPKAATATSTSLAEAVPESILQENSRFGRRIYWLKLKPEQVSDEKLWEHLQPFFQKVAQKVYDNVTYLAVSTVLDQAMFLHATKFEEAALLQPEQLPWLQSPKIEPVAPSLAPAAASEPTAVAATPAKPAVPVVAATSASAPAAVPPSATPPASPPANKPQGGGQGGEHGGDSTDSIRVKVTQLNKLMNLATQLVLTRNEVIQKLEGQEVYSQVLQALSYVTSEIQSTIMSTRLQSVSGLFKRFNRIVYDVARKLGKEVIFVGDGAEVELDRSIIEALSDPLNHLIRNALDHGLEDPKERMSTGKVAQGTLNVRAYHEGGIVNIEVQDDGRGIDPSRIKKKALERNVKSPQELSAMSDDELRMLIFLPGFSTAEAVTDISGRGVGMDVVRTNIEELGGKIDIRSEVYKGTTIKIRLPMTLAIISGLIVRVDSERYVIPQVGLVEVVRVEPETITERLHVLSNSCLLELRGEHLPLISLRDILRDDFPHDQIRFVKDYKDKVMYILILKSSQQRFGVVVDAVEDNQEIVVKPVAALLKSASIYGGATMLGDGSVTMILDINHLASLAQVIGEEEKQSRTVVKEQSTEEDQNMCDVLLCTGISGHFFALDIRHITRVIRIPRDALEIVGTDIYHKISPKPMRVMPLEPNDVSFHGEFQQPYYYAIVPKGEKVTAGLLVAKIVDTLRWAMPKQNENDMHITLGKTLIEGRVFDMLDIHQLNCHRQQMNLGETL